VSIVSRFRSFFASVEELDQEVARVLESEERDDATRRANLEFDRHGPDDYDLLPGSKRARLFRRGRRR
jgi:hypothetical protein